MPSPFITLTSNRRCTRAVALRMDAIASRHGARMVEIDSPTYRRWWEIPAGSTARQTEASIRGDIAAAGLLEDP